ncbi:MAG: flap endonuclease-1 [Candidatus Aenigmarchaeota archaeon]|nr:flap endonuclease-1 [Candidatus Aenigmarchaeota archaeon]
MGVNLRDIVTHQEISMESLSGKVIAIDALNIIYQFLSIIRDRFTGEPLKDSHGNVTSHLSGIFYRTSRMIENNITPVFIFDGEPPLFKKGTQEERRKIKEAAQEKLEEAIEKGDQEKIRLYAQQTSKVTDGMLDEAKRLLDTMGVQWVRAPSEGEAQASFMNRNGSVYACGSQDWDSLLFGAERLVRNLAVSGKRKLPGKESYVKVSPEMIELGNVLSQLSITREQLVTAGILIGTDYNPGGIKGIGPKKAIELVKEKGSFDKVMEHIDWTFDTAPGKIYDFFMNPPSAEVSIEKRHADYDKVTDILIGHDFSPERIKSTIGKIGEAAEKKKQSTLGSFI